MRAKEGKEHCPRKLLGFYVVCGVCAIVSLCRLLSFLLIIHSMNRSPESSSIDVDKNDSQVPTNASLSSQLFWANDSMNVPAGRVIGNTNYSQIAKENKTMEDGSSSSSSSNSSSFPYLVIAVGPPKTGTTAIQAFLTTVERKGILQRDNYTYLGRRLGRRKSQEPLLQAILNKHQTGGKICQNEDQEECLQQTIVQSLEKLNRNALMFEEYLSQADTNDVESFVKAAEKKFQIVFVICYRRDYELIPSGKNQLEKFRSSHGETPIWPKRRDPNQLYSPIRLPGETRDRILRNPEYYNHIAHHERKSSLQVTLTRYKPIIGNSTIRIMNYHHGDLIQHFSCDILPDAPKTCSRSRKKKLKKADARTTNPSTDLSHSLIAVEAADRGLINTIVPREKVEKHLRDCNLNIVKACPSQATLEAILGGSLRVEQTIQSDYSQGNPWLKKLTTAEHVQGFWKATDAYCSANLKIVFASSEWQQCFDGVNAHADQKSG